MWLPGPVGARVSEVPEAETWMRDFRAYGTSTSGVVIDCVHCDWISDELDDDTLYGLLEMAYFHIEECGP